MNRLSIFALAAAALMATGCAMSASPVAGVLYTDAKAGAMASSNTGASKEGKACASSILGLVGTGDASITAAAANGGISKVSYVDSHSTSILGLYATYCSVVRGE